MYANHEFVKQFIIKHAGLEKTLLVSLFLLTILRFFLLLSLIDFYKMNLFFYIEGLFLLILGSFLIFFKEFYSKIAKNLNEKYFILCIFLISVASNILEMIYAEIKEAYTLGIINIAILYLVLSNLW